MLSKARGRRREENWRRKTLHGYPPIWLHGCSAPPIWLHGAACRFGCTVATRRIGCRVKLPKADEGGRKKGENKTDLLINWLTGQVNLVTQLPSFGYPVTLILLPSYLHFVTQLPLFGYPVTFISFPSCLRLVTPSTIQFMDC